MPCETPPVVFPATTLIPPSAFPMELLTFSVFWDIYCAVFFEVFLTPLNASPIASPTAFPTADALSEIEFVAFLVEFFMALIEPSEVMIA